MKKTHIHLLFLLKKQCFLILRFGDEGAEIRLGNARQSVTPIITLYVKTY